MTNERGKMSSTLSVFGGGEACGARWTLGALLLAPLTAANSSYCAVPAVVLLAVFITIASKRARQTEQKFTVSLFRLLYPC